MKVLLSVIFALFALLCRTVLDAQRDMAAPPSEPRVSVSAPAVPVTQGKAETSADAAAPAGTLTQENAEALFVRATILYNDGEYEKALPLLHECADAGNVEAQFLIGVCNDFGWGVVTDYAEAEKWYRLAAERGHAEAQYMLGLMLNLYHAEEKESGEAAQWFELAAEQGHAGAHTCLETAIGTATENPVTQKKLWSGGRLPQSRMNRPPWRRSEDATNTASGSNRISTARWSFTPALRT